MTGSYKFEDTFILRIINKYKSLTLPMKAAIWFIMVNFLTKGISFITVPIFANYLSTEEYGKVSIYLTYQGVLINFATFEMYSGAYIRGMLRYKDNVPLFTWSEQLLSTVITIIVFLLCIPIMPWFVKNAQIDYLIYALMYCYFLLFPAYQCWVSRKRFDYTYKPVVVSAIVYSLISTIIPLVAVIKIDATASIRLLFLLIPEVIFCLPFYLCNLHFNELFSNKNIVAEQWKFLISFQAPSVVHALSYIILSSMDRIMIGKMVGNSEAGIYSVAATIANVITIFSISANQVLKPWRYQRMENGDYKIIKSTSNLILVVYGLVILLWILIAPDIMHLLFPKDYYSAVWVIPPISMAVYFVFLYSMFVDIEEYYYKTKYTMYATTISAVTNIILNYFGIKIGGYIACAYTTLICYILLALLHLFWSNKATKSQSIHLGQIFSVKFLCIFSMFLVAAEVLFTFTYNKNIVRYALFLFGTVIFLLNIKRIQPLIKNDRGK